MFSQSIRISLTTKGWYCQPQVILQLIYIIALFNIVQLKRHIEKEFKNEFPRDPAYQIKNLCLSSGYVLPNSSRVGDVLKQGESLIAYPEKEKLFEHNCDQFCTCQFKTPATDLINQLQDQQKSMASKLTEASIQRYDDKMELIRNTAAMGMTKDVRQVQNLALTLNKIITSPLAVEFDKDENKNTLNLLVLVLQYWCTDIVDKDQLVLINTMQTLECLSRSWTFTSHFKQQREAMEKLSKMAQDNTLSPSERNQIFRVVSTLSSTIDIKTLPEYNKAHFYNWRDVDSICKPDGNIISRSNLYKIPLNHQHLERGIRPNYAQTPNVAVSRSKKFRDPNKQVRFSGEDIEERKLYTSEQGQSKTLRQSQSSAVLPMLPNNQRSSNLQHSGGLQITQTTTFKPQKHDPCYFQEQEIAQKYSQGGYTTKKENLNTDRTGSYLINPYKVTFLQGNYPSLEKFPPIQMIYSGDLLKDYCTMLNPEINQRDIIVFALHSIDNMGMQAIRDIMQDKYLFLLCFQLLEYYNFPTDVSQSQFRVAERLVQNLTGTSHYDFIYYLVQRAQDILENNGINRILKNFKFQNMNMKKLNTDLIYKVLSYTRDEIDIPLLINLTLFQSQEIRNAAIKTICEISEPADLEGKIKQSARDRIDITFHIHIPYLLQICQEKRNNPQVYRNYALQTLVNLTSREYLKSYITFNKGLEVFVDYIKDTDNLNGMRIATKGLTQMALGDSEMKVKLMTTLRKEIKDTWDGVQDPVISAYLKKMLKEGINFDT